MRAKSQEDRFDELLRQVAHMPPVDPDLLPGWLIGQQLGPYRIKARIGAGGIGVVYLAEDQRLGREVALKQLSAKSGRDDCSPAWRVGGQDDRHPSLMREARSAAAVKHPNVAAIYDVGVGESGQPFIVMEYVEGRPLRARIRTGGLPWREALRLARPIAEGMAAAHVAGIVHRDLKPENVLVTDGGCVKILDFGLAGPNAVLDLSRAGTPRYAAPEQIRGEGSDVRSDVYSFGVILYELLWGKPPQAARGGKGRSPAARWSGATKDPARAPHKGRRVPGWIRRLVERCLSPEPEQRFADGGHLVEALAPRTTARFNRLAILVLPLIATGALALWLAAKDASHPATARPLERPSPPRRLSLHKLTFNSDRAPIRDAAISPDGKRVAFIDYRGLYLRDIDGAKQHRVTTEPAISPMCAGWFNDGRRLIVGGLVKGRRAPSYWTEGLWIVPVDGGRAVRLPIQALWGCGSPSPDGREIAVLTRRGIELIRARAPHHRRLIVRDGDAWKLYGTRAVWIDRHRLVFGRYGDYGAVRSAVRLDQVETRTGETRPVLHEPRLMQRTGNIGFTTLDDRRILFALMPETPGGPHIELWSLTPTSATRTKLERLPENHATQFSRDRSGRRIAFLGASHHDNVYLAPLEPGARAIDRPRRLGLSEHNELASAWSPDGESIWIVSDSLQGHHSFTLPTRGRDAATRALIEDPGWITWPVPVAGGRGVLYWALNSDAGKQGAPGQVRLMWLPADHRRPQLIHRGQTNRGGGAVNAPPSDWWLRCARQRARCVVSRTEGDAVRLFTVDLEEGRLRPTSQIEGVKPLHFGRWSLAPSGDRIAMATRGDGVHIYRLDGKREHRLLGPGLHCRFTFSDWAADGRALYAAAMCNDEDPHHHRLYYLGLDGEVVKLYATASGFVNQPLLSPDGRQLAFVLSTINSNVWLLER